MLQEYLDKKRRNKTKKMLRRTKPYLMGDKLEMEVDRVLGIADSGKMDWVELVESGKPTSAYSTPESISYDEIQQISVKYHVRAYLLYWYYLNKTSKLKASGRTKSDYLAFLEECAAKVAQNKSISNEEKIIAATVYAKNLKGVTITRSQAESMLITGEI